MSAADRQRACRQRKRERGEPSIQDLDKTLREAVLSAYQAGELTVDIPDMVQDAVERLSADGGASERGCRVIIKALLDKAGANAGGHARVQG
jgi:hypothetical protein